MIRSEFISRVMNQLLDSSDSKEWWEVLPVLTEIDYEYTGSGVFVSFGEVSPRQNQGTIDAIFDGLLIESPELESGATATIFIKNGKLSSLEIWAHSGAYPRQDLKDYQLKKTWK